MPYVKDRTDLWRFTCEKRAGRFNITILSQKTPMNNATNTIKKGRRYEQVLNGARQVFMTDGFGGASVDKIAKVAGVSKATLYSYFPDKRALFTEVARNECQRQADQAVAEININASPDKVLRDAGEHMVGFVLSDISQRFYRICVAEADRFPELARDFYDSGPRVAKNVLATYLELAKQRGELDFDDVDLAACQFCDLCKSDIFNKRLFGVQDSFTDAEIARIIDGAVKMFLARYGV